ncbi:hypothetical protein SLS62_010649 [Diatrype stigma]|uniref:SMODS and SLOG-associating 2TM effector domain-containing protein n=1 Tax=Diatrype stigma TaxID=117547 RepID=A0AAN9UAQ2_9PEZI
MASMLEAIGRLIFKGKPRQGRVVTIADEENAGNATAGTDQAPAAQSSALPVPTPTPISHQLHRNGHNYLIPADEPLTLFRLMVGIVTSEQLGFTQSNPIGIRPAPNIGIYARVVHSEQHAKDSFKVFSAVVNACYFFQIVVAAGLTAMSAGGAARGAITAFGAINTVIAGFLTYLKGSGLPGRLKYYGNEWKKIREYIEQRERDFARVGCTLNVYEVVETIENMYKNTKQDIEMNTPDSYTSILANQRQLGYRSEGAIGGIEVSQLEGIADRIQGLDETVERITANIHKRTQSITDNIHEHEKEMERRVHGIEKAVVRNIEEHMSRLEREAQERGAQVGEAAEGSTRAAAAS